nr:reverse transcriptase domain-containing protein [Tanacetum cinerariifolium]
MLGEYSCSCVDGILVDGASWSIEVDTRGSAKSIALEAKALSTNDARVVVKFLKSLFARFGTPRTIISDRGENHASWSDKLDDALWAFRTAFKTPIRRRKWSDEINAPNVKNLANLNCILRHFIMLRYFALTLTSITPCDQVMGISVNSGPIKTRIKDFFSGEVGTIMSLGESIMSLDTREQSGQPVMTKEEDDGISVALDPQDDLVNEFVNQFFPPLKTTHLKNEISRFTQRFEETFGEAWERFKETLRACPHHRFTELTQIDTFYNGLNDNDQDFLNVTAGGNLLSKTTREALNIIENKSKVRYSRYKPNVFRMNTTSRENASKTDDRIDKLADRILTLVEIVSKKVVTSATVKAVEESCVTCGGNHDYYNCDATNINQLSVCAATGTYNQVAP